MITSRSKWALPCPRNPSTSARPSWHHGVHPLAGRPRTLSLNGPNDPAPARPPSLTADRPVLGPVLGPVPLGAVTSLKCATFLLAPEPLSVPAAWSSCLDIIPLHPRADFCLNKSRGHEETGKWLGKQAQGHAFVVFVSGLCPNLSLSARENGPGARLFTAQWAAPESCLSG